MEEIFIVDRIENGYAVCETEQGEKKDIPLSGTKDVRKKKKDTRPTGGSVGLRQHRMMRYA